MRTPLATQVTYYSSGKETLSGASDADRRSDALEVGRWYTLFVGTVAVRVEWGGSSVTADGDSAHLPAGTALSWQVENGLDYVIIIDEDGSSTTGTAVLMPSSPPA